MGAKVAAVPVPNHGAEWHKLKAPKEAVVYRQTVLGLALVLQKSSREGTESAV